MKKQIYSAVKVTQIENNDDLRKVRQKLYEAIKQNNMPESRFQKTWVPDRTNHEVKVVSGEPVNITIIYAKYNHYTKKDQVVIKPTVAVEYDNEIWANWLDFDETDFSKKEEKIPI